MAVQHSFTYNRVTIRNQKTRWGSCSHKNNISLNMKLVLLPEDLVGYVILYELVHTKIHSIQFNHVLYLLVPLRNFSCSEVR
ncbi:M48 family metallopeptidase [Chloroflexota bacterium]